MYILPMIHMSSLPIIHMHNPVNISTPKSSQMPQLFSVPMETNLPSRESARRQVCRLETRWTVDSSSLVVPRPNIRRVTSYPFCGLTISRQRRPQHVTIKHFKNCGNYHAKPRDYTKCSRELGPGEMCIWVGNGRKHWHL